MSAALAAPPAGGEDGAPVLPVVPSDSAGGLVVPKVLPVSSLSKSSIELFERCPEAWRRKYVLDEEEPTSGAMAAGKAFGATLAAYFQEKRDSRVPTDAEVDERMAAELEQFLASATLKPKEDAEKIRQGARDAVLAYIETFGSKLSAVATERKMRLRFPGCEWSVVAYLDLETEDDRVIDYKLKAPGGHHMSETDALKDLQATLYTLGRKLEGAPAADFAFHSGLSHEPSTVPRWKEIPAPRTELQLANCVKRIALVARQIARAVASGDWGYRTDSWFCGPNFCPSFASCPAGGLR
jgi:uncharacterized protein (DUF2267 family)